MEKATEEKSKDIKSEIRTKHGIDITDHTVKLINKRRKDNPDTFLPKIPSGQMWSNMNAGERNSFNKLMEANGLNPEQILKLHRTKTPSHHGTPNVWRKR